MTSPDARIRALEREARGAAPGSPERQRWLVELHRRGVDPLPLVAGDLVRIVSYYAHRGPSSFDGALAEFRRWDGPEVPLPGAEETPAAPDGGRGRAGPASNLRPHGHEAIVYLRVGHERVRFASWIAPVDPGEGAGDPE